MDQKKNCEVTFGKKPKRRSINSILKKHEKKVEKKHKAKNIRRKKHKRYNILVIITHSIEGSLIMSEGSVERQRNSVAIDVYLLPPEFFLKEKVRKNGKKGVKKFVTKH